MINYYNTNIKDCFFVFFFLLICTVSEELVLITLVESFFYTPANFTYIFYFLF